MTVFQAIVYYLPKEKDNEKVEPEIIFDIKTYIEKSSELLEKKLLRLIPEEYNDKIENVKILIRPF